MFEEVTNFQNSSIQNFVEDTNKKILNKLAEIHDKLDKIPKCQYKQDYFIKEKELLTEIKNTVKNIQEIIASNPINNHELSTMVEYLNSISVYLKQSLNQISNLNKDIDDLLSNIKDLQTYIKSIPSQIEEFYNNKIQELEEIKDFEKQYFQKLEEKLERFEQFLQLLNKQIELNEKKLDSILQIIESCILKYELNSSAIINVQKQLQDLKDFACEIYHDIKYLKETNTSKQNKKSFWKTILPWLK